MQSCKLKPISPEHALVYLLDLLKRLCLAFVGLLPYSVILYDSIRLVLLSVLSRATIEDLSGFSWRRGFREAYLL
jgi:hypothetical protein